MRVFIAIDLPEEIRSRLGALQKELGSADDSARWVASGSIHITLKYQSTLKPTGSVYTRLREYPL